MVELLNKAEGETDPDFGCPPKDRPMKEHLFKGVINLINHQDQLPTKWIPG